ncbi:hypothetical protein AAW18_17510 [Xanthomonas campestris pv. campestris]|nr:hypothetical protein AEA00_02980 [Xanthomonas campestris pv. campestris]AKS19010.1 hypothetical protein AEA01_03010 [Xanthomonas campestris pv. campestris]ALE70082.1 hypothetical protein AAW18_17510 [Xanthomonas campestris pv. campestris]
MVPAHWFVGCADALMRFVSERVRFPNESHGFYTEAHGREYYTRLLALLSKELGGSAAVQ